MENSWDKTRINRWGVVLLFLLALGYNLWGVSYHFTMGFLAGHEFRQSQTAIISHYIDKEDNFGLLYEMPVLGKPWVAILLEVPIYEWSVVGLSRLTGWEHVIAARTISIACFYMTLGAVWLLLGQLGVARAKRLLFCALILTTPVYIFYSRAFLMDSMALMGSVWWLYAFVRVMQDRSWRWLLVAVATGSVAALVKGAVYVVWLVPGAAYGAWLLWNEVKRKVGLKRLIQTTAWGLSTVVIALGLLKSWLAYTDPIKEAHASAWIFTSKNVSLGNWGMLSPSALLSADVWKSLMHCWEQAILSRWLLASVMLIGIFLKRARWPVVGIGGMFFLAQFLMPYAFAYQDYYFYICALFAVVAMAWVVAVMIETPKWSWAGWVLAIVVIGAQVKAYFSDYYNQQSVIHKGGYPFTDVIRDMTPTNSVIVVAGADWAAMTPLYSERRALMVRNGLEYDRAYLARAFGELDGEVVSAIVLWNQLRHNRDFIEQAASQLGFNSDEPTFSWEDHADIYINPIFARAVQLRLLNEGRYPGIKLPDSSILKESAHKKSTLTSLESELLFPQIRPLPEAYFFEQGVDWMDLGYRKVLSVHPDTDLWITPPPDSSVIEWNFGIFDSAWTKDGDKTDGVVFTILAESDRGTSRMVYERVLNPTENKVDRGDQHELISYVAEPGEKLRFSTRSNKGKAYDWAYTVSIEIH